MGPRNSLFLPRRNLVRQGWAPALGQPLKSPSSGTFGAETKGPPCSGTGCSTHQGHLRGEAAGVQRRKNSRVVLMSLSPTSCRPGCVDPLNQQHELDHFHQQTPERKDAENNLIMFVTINLSLFMYFSPGLDAFWDSGALRKRQMALPPLGTSLPIYSCVALIPLSPSMLHPWLLYLSEAPHLIDAHILGDLPWHLTHPAREAPIP